MIDGVKGKNFLDFFFFLEISLIFCFCVIYSLKQVEEYKARVESDLHEINKPLARYSDDKDLDELLKQQDRDGDPMAEYMRRKQETKKSGEPGMYLY